MFTRYRPRSRCSHSTSESDPWSTCRSVFVAMSRDRKKKKTEETRTGSFHVRTRNVRDSDRSWCTHLAVEQEPKPPGRQSVGAAVPAAAVVIFLTLSKNTQPHCCNKPRGKIARKYTVRPWIEFSFGRKLRVRRSNPKLSRGAVAAVKPQKPYIVGSTIVRRQQPYQ